MAQDYIVTRAFIGTVDGDKSTPEVIQTKAGACHKYVFQVEEYPGWFNTLRKIEDGKSKPLSVGDTVYGTFEENNYGKLAFIKAQRPFTPGQAGATPPSQAKVSTGAVTNEALMAELKYIRGILENSFRNEKAPGAVTHNDDDDEPVDLTGIDY